MLINTVEGVECRIAIVSGGALEELYLERASSASRVGNIYKGRVSNLEPAIQAAFVDFGMIKNGFLHISDLHPQYFPKGKAPTEAVGRKQRHRDRPPIQDCLRRGQEVIVQMTKEGIGTKGPTLTTYLSLPGRYLVMMPGMSRLGVSRKIEDQDIRDKARDLLSGLSLPADIGFIVRTAGLNRPKRDLQRDLNYLLRLWKSVKDRIKTSKAPAEIYQESDLVIRTVRDVYNTHIERIICDKPADALKIKEFLDVAMPRGKHVIQLYVGKEGLFHDYGLEEEIEKIYSRRVELPSGGSLVIDQTEALVAIDVNSGRFHEHSDAETTATKINLQAAEELARQLRLRDLGGVIIIDFIDMREEKNRRAVEKTIREAMKNDRAKIKIQRISSFGIVEMTRQRMRPSLKDSIYALCPACNGSGHLKSEESLSLEIMRTLQRLCHVEAVAHIRLAVAPPTAHHLSNYRRKQIGYMEDNCGKTIVVEADEQLRGDEVRVTCTNNRGSEVAWEHPTAPRSAPRALATVDISAIPVAPGRRMTAEGQKGDKEGTPLTPAPAAELPGPMPQAGPARPPTPAAPTGSAPPTPHPSTGPFTPPSGPPSGPPAAGQPTSKRRRRGRRGRRRGRGQGPPQPPLAFPATPAPARSAGFDAELSRSELAASQPTSVSTREPWPPTPPQPPTAQPPGPPPPPQPRQSSPQPPSAQPTDFGELSSSLSLRAEGSRAEPRKRRRSRRRRRPKGNSPPQGPDAPSQPS
jgi:ribonuclease E